MGMRNALIIGGLAAICGFMPNNVSDEPKKTHVAEQILQNSPPQVLASRDPLDQRIEEFFRKWGIEFSIDKKVREDYSRTPIDIAFMKDWVDGMDKQLEKINPPLLKYVRRIEIYDYGAFSSSFGVAYLDKGLIGLNVNSIFDVSTLAHELSHLFFGNMPGFYEEWNDLVAVDPRDENIRSYFYDRFFGSGRYGFVRGYGALYCSGGFLEDPATYVEDIYRNFSGLRKVRDRDNPVYERKLGLLLYSGAITQEQFDEARNNLGIDSTTNREITLDMITIEGRMGQ